MHLLSSRLAPIILLTTSLRQSLVHATHLWLPKVNLLESYIPINMPLRASTGPVLVRCCQHRTRTGPVLATNGMFTWIQFFEFDRMAQILAEFI